jgi:hypothetical protein
MGLVCAARVVEGRIHCVEPPRLEAPRLEAPRQVASGPCGGAVFGCAVKPSCRRAGGGSTGLGLLPAALDGAGPWVRPPPSLAGAVLGQCCVASHARAGGSPMTQAP